MPRIQTIILLLTSSILLLGTTNGVSIGKDYGPESPMVNAYWLSREIIVTTEKAAEYPAVAFNWKRGEYLVMWGWPDGIYGQRINIFGEKVGPTNFPIATGSKLRKQPVLDYDPVNDRYFAVWRHDTSGFGNLNDISGRIIPWDGPSQSFKEFHIDSNPNNQQDPRVVYNPAEKNYLVIWSDRALQKIYGVQVGALNGNIIGSAKEISTSSNEYTSADLSFNAYTGEYLVAWDRWNGNPTNWDIHGIRLKGDDLTPLGVKEFVISQYQDDEVTPAAAACRDTGHYLVTWQSSANTDIYARIVLGDGTNSTIYPLQLTTRYESSPDVACTTSGKHWLAVWQQENISGKFGISGRLVDTGGGTDPPFEIIPPSDDFPHSSYPAVAGGDDQYMVVAVQACKIGGCHTIHARIVYFFEEPPSKIYVFKHTQPRYTGGFFEVELSGGPDSIKRTFHLKDDDVPYNSGPLKAGSYDLDEVLYDKWKFVSLTCDRSPDIHPIILPPADVMTCTYVNKYPVTYDYLPLILKNK